MMILIDNSLDGTISAKNVEDGVLFKIIFPIREPLLNLTFMRS